MTGLGSSRRVFVLCTLAASVVFAPQTLFAVQKKSKCRWPGSMWSTSANLYLDRARSNANLEEKRDLFQKTVEVSLEGIRKDSDNAQHYARAAEGYIGLGNLPAADSLLKKAQALLPACEEEIGTIRYNAWVQAYNAGVTHLRSDETERALEQFERAALIHDKRSETFLRLGSLYARMSNDLRLEGADGATAPEDTFLQKALDAYRKALEIAQKPDEREVAAFNLAQLLALNDRFEEAVEAYRAFLATDPEHVIAQTNLGVSLVRLANHLEEQDTPEAKTRAQEARAEAKAVYLNLADRPGLSLSDLRQVASGLSAVNEHAAAARAFRMILEEQPYDYDALVRLANSFYLADQPDSLLKVAEKLVELYPNRSQLLAFLAHAHREAGNTRAALAVLEERDRMKVEVADLTVEFNEETNALTVRGRLENRSLAPGTPIELRFELLDSEGQIVATETVSKPAPSKDSTVDFEVKAQASDRIAGFRYSIL